MLKGGSNSAMPEKDEVLELQLKLAASEAEKAALREQINSMQELRRKSEADA